MYEPVDCKLCGGGLQHVKVRLASGKVHAVKFPRCCIHLIREAHVRSREAVFQLVAAHAFMTGEEVDLACCSACLEESVHGRQRERAIPKLKQHFKDGFKFSLPGHQFPYFWGPNMPAAAKEGKVIKAFEESALAAIIAGVKGDDITSRALDAAREAAR